MWKEFGHSGRNSAVTGLKEIFVLDGLGERAA